MTTKIIAQAAFSATLFVAVGFLNAQIARSVKDGVYTAEQAKRGKVLYSAQCAQCHGEELLGGDETPPLAGAPFMANWKGLTVNDLFERIRVSMPANNPGRLTRQQNADILAYIFAFNRFPAGKAELASQAETLKEIRIEESNP